MTIAKCGQGWINEGSCEHEGDLQDCIKCICIHGDFARDCGMETPTDIYNRLAREFSATIREWLTSEELAEMIERNKTETNSSICHSHDFCDPNMAMLGAMETVLGIDVDEVMVEEGNKAIQNAETAPIMTAWNEAWTIAKSNEFRNTDGQLPLGSTLRVMFE